MSLYEAPDSDEIHLRYNFLTVLKKLALIKSKVFISSHTTFDVDNHFSPTQYEITIEL